MRMFAAHGNSSPKRKRKNTNMDYWYDWGYRHGVFDRCNSKTHANTSGWNELARDGYEDAWSTNEPRI